MIIQLTKEPVRNDCLNVTCCLDVSVALGTMKHGDSLPREIKESSLQEIFKNRSYKNLSGTRQVHAIHAVGQTDFYVLALIL